MQRTIVDRHVFTRLIGGATWSIVPASSYVAVTYGELVALSSSIISHAQRREWAPVSIHQAILATFLDTGAAADTLGLDVVVCNPPPITAPEAAALVAEFGLSLSDAANLCLGKSHGWTIVGGSANLARGYRAALTRSGGTLYVSDVEFACSWGGAA